MCLFIRPIGLTLSGLGVTIVHGPCLMSTKAMSPLLHQSLLLKCELGMSASLKFVRSKVEKLLLLTYEKITIYRIPNYLHSFPA